MGRRGYQLMWAIAMFDLPTRTKPQRKRAAKFRHRLLELGFEMAQLSVYSRVTGGKEHLDAIVKKVRAAVPPEGRVYIMWLTDHQMKMMVRIENRSRQPAKEAPGQLVLFA